MDPLPSFLDGRSFVTSFVSFDYGGLELDFEETEDGGLIRGFHVGPIKFDGVCISHFFVDDTILF